MYSRFIEDGIDIFYDDRDERPGIKFSDADLLGIPFVIIIGKNYLKKKSVTIINKYSDKEIEIPESDATNQIKKLIKLDD